MTKYTHYSTKIAGTALIAIGAISMALGSQLQMEAQLISQRSGQGSSVMIEEAVINPILLKQSSLHAAALTSSDGAGTLAFGMVMMLLGFGLHAWIVLSDRRVKVKVADPHKKKITPKNTTRKTRKPMEIIWIERTIRF